MLPEPQASPLAVGAPPQDQAPPNPLVTIPMTEDARKKWKGDLDRANSRRQIFEKAWERNLAAYAPDPTNETWGADVNPGIDFYQTEQKKAQLFFDTPAIVLTPEDDTPPEARPQIAAWQTKINRKLGPIEKKGLGTIRMMDKVLFSIICPSGMGWTKLGVTRITKDVPMDPAQPDGPTAPVPVFQQMFWEHLSEKKGLIPTNFHDTEFDKAPWLGMNFTMPTRAGIREFNLPPDFVGQKSGANEQVFEQPGIKKEADTDDQMTGREVWYRAALYDDAVYHPDHLRQLVFVDGIDEPVVHRDSPYQTFANGLYQPDDPNNLIGFPIHIFTIRDLVDSSYVPSDSTITRPLVNEISRFRTQLIEQRDSSTSIRLGDEKVLTPEILSKVVRGPWGSIILLPDLDPNRPPVVEMAKTTYPRESFEAQNVMERDLSKITAQGANQVGAEEDHAKSATETSFMQQNSNTRMAKERNRVLAGFTAGVAKLDALMKRFETPQGQPPVSGYTYDIKPDSGVHVDEAARRKFATDRYNMIRKDPRVQADYLLTELAPEWHLDATKLIAPPPQPHADPPRTSVIIRTESLSPMMPEYANTIELMKILGIPLTAVPITNEMMQNAALAKPIKPPVVDHPGTPPEADHIDKHTSDMVGHHANAGGFAGAVQ